MAQPGSVIHVIGAHEARELLGRVVDLVGQPPRGQIHRQPPRIDRAQLVGNAIQCLVPRDAAEPAVAARPHHGMRQSAKLAQLARRQRRQRGSVREQRRIERRRRIQPHQLQTHHAQVRAWKRPVRESRGPKRATVAHPLSKNAPGKRQRIAVLPDDPRHFDVVMRFLAAETEEVDTQECVPLARCHGSRARAAWS